MKEYEAAAGRRGQRVVLVIQATADSDEAELDRLTGQLRRRLLELEVENVELMQAGELPPGAKAVDPIAIGSLVVTLVPPAIQGLIGLVQSWAKDRPVSSIRVTLGDDSLELTNASPEQLERLTRAFINRHST